MRYTIWYGTYEDHANTLNELVLKRFRIIEKMKNYGYINKYGVDRRIHILNLTKTICLTRRWLNKKYKTENKLNLLEEYANTI